MRRSVGPILIAIGVLDLLVVYLESAPQFAAIAQDGFFNTVWWPGMSAPMFDRETAFWHLMFGTTVAMLGGLVHWAQASTQTLPAFFGWSLIALGTFGVVLMPVSGFWAVFVPAILVLLVARSDPKDKLSQVGRS